MAPAASSPSTTGLIFMKFGRAAATQTTCIEPDATGPVEAIDGYGAGRDIESLAPVMFPPGRSGEVVRPTDPGPPNGVEYGDVARLEGRDR